MDPLPQFKVTTRRPNDVVAVFPGKNRVKFDIRSPFGISQATIERLEKSWPEKVVVALRLKGLESFAVSNDKIKIEGAAGIQAGQPMIRQWQGKEEDTLDDKSPFWIQVFIRDAKGRPATSIPLDDKGYFLLELPGAFFASNPRAITVHWIDFWRN